MQNLCIMATCFPNRNDSYYGGIFIKRELEELRKYFKSVYVIVPVAFGSKENMLCFNYEYENITIFFPRYFHIPIHYFRTRSGYKHAAITQKVINENKLKFDILYCHNMWQSGYAGTLLKYIYNVPTIVVGHGSDVRLLLLNKSWLKKKLNRTMLHADTVLVNHEELKNLLLFNYEEHTKKIKFNYKGIDLYKFGGIKEKDKNKFVILFVGNLNKFKDPWTFIEAANILINVLEKKDIIFKIVGIGPMETICKNLSNGYNLYDYIEFLGSKSDVENYYKNCDIFCSLSPIENIWSTTLQEALCSNKPCIVTKSGYSKIILTQKKDAYLIDKENPIKLVRAILKIKSNKKLRNKLSNTEWTQKFDLVKTTKKLYKIMRTTKCH